MFLSGKGHGLLNNIETEEIIYTPTCDIEQICYYGVEFKRVTIYNEYNFEYYHFSFYGKDFNKVTERDLYTNKNLKEGLFVFDKESDISLKMLHNKSYKLTPLSGFEEKYFHYGKLWDESRWYNKKEIRCTSRNTFRKAMQNAKYIDDYYDLQECLDRYFLSKDDCRYFY